MKRKKKKKKRKKLLNFNKYVNFDFKSPKVLLFSIYCILSIILLLFNLEDFYEDKSNGTGIIADVSEYNFTPFLSTESNTITQKFRPQHNYVTSLEIRLANEHPDKINDDLLFRILDDNNKLIYKQIVNSGEIENWRYYKLKLNQKLNSFKTYKLEISCQAFNNEERIPFKVFLCNINLKENKELYYDDSYIDGELDIIYSYNVFRLLKLCIVLLIILICSIAFFIDYDYYNKKSLKIWLANILLLISIIFSVISIEVLSFNSIINLNSIAIIFNIILVALIYYVFLLITNRFYLAIIIGNILCYIMGILNHFTLLFRGNIILPLDVFAITTAVEVSGNYIFKLDQSILIMTIIYLSLILLSLKFNKEKMSIKPRLVMSMVILAVGSFTFYSCFNENITQKYNISIRQDAQTGRSKEIGSLLNFVENIPYIVVEKPEDYSVQLAEDILLQFEPQNNKINEKKPTIIAIMNESFSDLRQLGDIKTTSDFMPYVNNLNGNNVKKGHTVVPVFGGGTSYSEFEFLTGCSKLFLPEGSAPYQQYIYRETPSLATVLNEQGYTSLALHPANPKSWNRDKAYPLLGFSNFINTDNSFQAAERCRYWVSDRGLYNEMIDIYENKNKDENLFMFGITIQGHGGYEYENFENTVEVTNLSKKYKGVDQYLSLIKDCDAAFGELVDYFKNINEPVIILMFGDHYPGLEDELYNELLGKTTANYMVEDNVKLHATPYVFWANYDIDNVDIPKLTGVNFLSTFLLEASGVSTTSYNKFLLELSKTLPVVTGIALQDNQNKMYSINDENNYSEIVHAYSVLQYNYLFDKKNRIASAFSINEHDN